MFAALHIPDLGVLAALQAFPGKRGQPCALLGADLDPEASAEKMKLPLQALNEIARGTGIGKGWPLNRALVRCPDLQVLPPHPGNEAALLEQLVALGESLSPDLEIAGSDTVLLDLSRSTFRHRARLGFLEAGEIPVRHVLARTPDLAKLAVQHEACAGREIAPAEIAGLPLGLLSLLPGGADFLPLLEDWGLETLGGFMRLPRQALTARLGAQAGEWHDLLHGKSCRLLRLHRPPESLEQTLDFEVPVTSTEPLAFAFKRLLHALSARLAARHVAVKELRITFGLEGGASFARTIRLPEPRVEESELLRPILVLLDSLKTGSGITGLRLDAEAIPPTAAQRDWFIRQLPHPARWTDTLAQLEGLLGPGKVGIPVSPTSHRPDDFRLHPADGAGAPEKSPFLPECPVPLRRFRPPHPVAVAADLSRRQPRPLALLSGPYRGEITEHRGPFTRSGHWWDAGQAWQRLEWDIRLANRHLLRLAFLPPDRWQLDGLYF